MPALWWIFGISVEVLLIALFVYVIRTLGNYLRAISR